MVDEFKCDIFLNHSSKDKSVALPLVERLRKEGVKVWFDEWEIKSGDNISTKMDLFSKTLTEEVEQRLSVVEEFATLQRATRFCQSILQKTLTRGLI